MRLPREDCRNSPSPFVSFGGQATPTGPRPPHSRIIDLSAPDGGPARNQQTTAPPTRPFPLVGTRREGEVGRQVYRDWQHQPALVVHVVTDDVDSTPRSNQLSWTGFELVPIQVDGTIPRVDWFYVFHQHRTVAHRRTGPTSWRWLVTRGCRSVGAPRRWSPPGCPFRMIRSRHAPAAAPDGRPGRVSVAHARLMKAGINSSRCRSNISWKSRSRSLK